MMVLQELASAPKVTLQDQDGRLIENLKENLVAQFERAVLNRDAGWFERQAKAIRWNDRRTKSQKERAAFNRNVILMFEQACVRQGKPEDLMFTPAGKFTDQMASDVYKALENHELPNGHLIVEGCRFEKKTRTMDAIYDLAKQIDFGLKSNCTGSAGSTERMLIRCLTMEAANRCHAVAVYPLKSAVCRAQDGAGIVGAHWQGQAPPAAWLPSGVCERHQAWRRSRSASP